MSDDDARSETHNDRTTATATPSPEGSPKGSRGMMSGMEESEMNNPESHYEGMMRDGRRNGHGRLVFKYGVYEGNWVNDMMEGHGKMVLKSGNVYEGEFVRNRFDGKGVLRWRNGKEYTGTMRSGNMCGRGKLVSKDGEYEGDFYHNEYFGNGTMRFANGDVYTGEWKQDMMWGQGVLVAADGTSYDGSFYKHQKHGRILRTDPKGKQYSERYEHDQVKASFKVKKTSKPSSAVEKFLSKVTSSPTETLFERSGATAEDVARHLDKRAKYARQAKCAKQPRELDCDDSDGLMSPVRNRPPPVAEQELPHSVFPKRPVPCPSSPQGDLPPPLPPCPPPPADHFSSFREDSGDLGG